MYFVSSQIIRALVHFLIAQGLASTELDALLATRARYLNESRYRFPIEDYEQLMSYAEKTLQCDHIGLKFGQSLKTQSWGLLGHIALVSEYYCMRKSSTPQFVISGLSACEAITR